MSLILITFFGVIACSIATDPIVETKNGLILGKSHGHYYSFEGIPYAEPPVGDRRFEPPARYFQKYDGIYNATKLHESCMRYDPMEVPDKTVLIGSEDCLYLNIYTPNIDSYKLYPVMFYIHGGAFMFGSGDDLRENTLMDHGEMILVTFNYRLGPLGFLSTGDTEISGNMGLKDQRLALKWIKDNIRSFNGNPDQILMSGFSAGAASVQYHLLSPGIENYVNAAASFSGTVFDPWAMIQNPLSNAVKISNLINCTKVDNAKDLSTKDIKDCLKSVNAEDLVLAVKNFQVFHYNPMIVFGPVIESKNVKNSFLNENPKSLIKQGYLSKIPWITSFNTLDGGLTVAKLFDPNGEILAEFNMNPRNILASILLYDKDMNESQLKEYSNKIWKKYNLPEVFTDSDYNNLAELATDIFLKNGFIESMKLHGTHSPGHTYGYIYDIPAEFGWANYVSKNNKMHFGSVHGDDVFLFLDYPRRDMGKFPFRKDEKENSLKFVNMLEVFAKTRILKYGAYNLAPYSFENNVVTKITRDSISTHKIDEFFPDNH